MKNAFAHKMTSSANGRAVIESANRISIQAANVCRKNYRDQWPEAASLHQSQCHPPHLRLQQQPIQLLLLSVPFWVPAGAASSFLVRWREQHESMPRENEWV